MKENIKNTVTLLGIALLVAFSFYGWLSYETRYKVTYAGRADAPDGTTAVIFQMLGEVPADPGDMTNGRFIVKQGDEEIKTVAFQVCTQGKPLQEDNWKVEFYPAGAEVTLVETAGDGGESFTVYYDGSDEFSGYSEEEIVREICDRYDDEVSYLNREGAEYRFQADGFEFCVNNDFRMTDDYEESFFAYLAQEFSYGHNRITEFEKSGDVSGEAVYTPVVEFYGRQAGESESFSNACCDLVEELQETVGFEKIGYFGEDRRRYFDLVPYLKNYDRMELYNALYQAIEQDSLEEWQYRENKEAGNTPEVSEGAPPAWIMEEMPEEWRDYEADCFYRKKDGTELRMVGIDRAAGSTYYVLIKAVNGINTSVENRDPYLGYGGGAKWLDFLEDEMIGFSCLSYCGGSLGSLYRTEDGGKSFAEITWPSANRELSDGSLYNPFVMPEKVWKEGESLYMLVGQGPEGDYYEDGVWVAGLYESEDLGKSWTYLGVEKVEDTRE